jgi:FKBP-type peptidyl-prolyl cis-trans isomerase FkpA
MRAGHPGGVGRSARGFGHVPSPPSATRARRACQAIARPPPCLRPLRPGVTGSGTNHPYPHPLPNMPLRRLTLTVVLAASASLTLGCNPDGSTAVGPEVPIEQQVWGSNLGVNLAAMTKLPSGVYIQDLTVGTGAAVSGTDGTVAVFYTGYLASGLLFTNKARPDAADVYPLAQFIDGWRLGLQGMKVGGIRRLIIPASLAYGIQGSGPIPPNANLVFDVELVGIS